MKFFAALDPSSVAGSGAGHPAETKLFLHLLRQCCFLGIAPSDGPTLLRQVGQLPADLQILWTEVLKTRLARTDLVIADHESLGPCRLPSSSAREIPQIVDATSGATCGTCGSDHGPWRQFAVLPRIIACTALQTSNTVARGSRREDVYRDNLQAMAKNSDNCIIIDRYAGSRLVRRGAQSGLSWLGERLVSDGVRRIVLVTAAANVTAEEIDDASNRLADPAIQSAIRVEVLPDSKFARFAHDRFILLQVGQAGCAFSLGKGLELFERSTTSQESSFSGVDGSTVARVLGDLGVRAASHFV